MNPINEFILRSIFIGVGATAVMDLWASFLRIFKVPSLNFAFLGRWIGHISRGKFLHAKISNSAPIRHELLIGWCAHYAIGISFAGLLLLVFGLEWGGNPTLLPALYIGVGTVIAPLLILQPALGAGIASRKTPTPLFNSLKSLVTHLVFGIGLYLAAALLTLLYHPIH
jgi:Protein of unknown function (DUF2938)